MLEYDDYSFEMPNHKFVQLNGDVAKRTVEVTVLETVKRVIEVEIPDNYKDEFATDVAFELYSHGHFYLDGDDTVDNVEFELT